jgi:hypothetical protein
MYHKKEVSRPAEGIVRHPSLSAGYSSLSTTIITVSEPDVFTSATPVWVKDDHGEPVEIDATTPDPKTYEDVKHELSKPIDITEARPSTIVSLGMSRIAQQMNDLPDGYDITK